MMMMMTVEVWSNIRGDAPAECRRYSLCSCDVCGHEITDHLRVISYCSTAADAKLPSDALFWLEAVV
jgi:hypothetical protein